MLWVGDADVIHRALAAGPFSAADRPALLADAVLAAVDFTIDGVCSGRVLLAAVAIETGIHPPGWFPTTRRNIRT